MRSPTNSTILLRISAHTSTSSTRGRAQQRRPSSSRSRTMTTSTHAVPPPARLGAAIALGCLDAIGVRGFFRARAGARAFRPCRAHLRDARMRAHDARHEQARVVDGARIVSPRMRFLVRGRLRSAPLLRAARTGTRRTCAALEAMANATRHSRIFLICGSYAFPVDGGSERASIAVALDENGMPLGYHDMAGRLDAGSSARPSTC